MQSLGGGGYRMSNLPQTDALCIWGVRDFAQGYLGTALKVSWHFCYQLTFSNSSPASNICQIWTHELIVGVEEHYLQSKCDDTVAALKAF